MFERPFALAWSKGTALRSAAAEGRQRTQTETARRDAMKLSPASLAVFALVVALTAASSLSSASRVPLPPFFPHWSSAPSAAPTAPSSVAAVLPQPLEDIQSFLLALRLMRRPDSLPLVGCNVLAHARLQRCRPSFPLHQSALLPPSLRLPPPSTGTTSTLSSGSKQQPASQPLLPYPQLECVSEWAENWALRSNDAGLVPLQLRLPTARFNQLQRLLEDSHALPSASSSSQLVTSTRRLHFQLHRQCPALTGTDLLWLDIMDFSSSKATGATAVAERKFEAQGLVALLINTPRLPGYRSDLETRQVLWPFDPRGQLE